MRKKAIIFFLVSALLIVIGHSIFPHTHVQGLCCAHCISLQKSLTLSDIIKNTLSQDLGSHHLEEYSVRNQSESSFNGFEEVLSQLDFWALSTVTDSETTIYAHSHPLLSQQICPCQGCRAPPHII